MHRNKRRLQNTWTRVFTSKFKEENPSCSLRFFYNHITKNNSRKKGVDFFVGKAKCAMTGCLSYKFVIRKCPKKDKPVKVRVRVIEDPPVIRHEKETKCRPISGNVRQIVGQKVRSEGVSNVFYKALGNISQQAYLSGNRDDVGTKNALKQISSEVNRAERLHQDILLEIFIARDIYIEDDLGSKVIKGYIQNVSVFPFTCHLYTERQLQILLHSIAAGTSDLYFDATGCVIGKIPFQADKSVFYYSLVLNSQEKGLPGIPVAEMISNSHTTADIANFLHRVQRSLRALKPSVQYPRKIEVDFSWALIHGVLLGLNQETLLAYICKKWRELQKKEVTEKCLVHICAAHMIHSYSRKLGQLTNDKELRQLHLYIFATMQNSSSIEEITDVFKNLCVISLSTQETNTVQSSLKTLHGKIKSKDETDIYFEYCKESIETDDDCADPNKLRSTPFAVHFNLIRDRIKQEIQTESDKVDNPYYLPKLIDFLLNNYMALVPLWTGIFLEGKTRDTNAVVEGWFSIVKNSILQRKMRNTPGAFIRRMHGSLVGRMREFEENLAKTEVKEVFDDTGLYFAEEKWDKSNKNSGVRKGKYYQVPKEIPKPKMKKTMATKEHTSQSKGSDCLNKHEIKKKTSKFKKEKEARKTQIKAPAWGAQVKYKNELINVVNTCPVDNLLYFNHLILTNNPVIREWFMHHATNLRPCEALLSASKFFADGQFNEGKCVWLDAFGTYRKNQQTWDVWGSESEQFVLPFGPIQRTTMESTCNFSACPRPRKTVTSDEILLPG